MAKGLWRSEVVYAKTMMEGPVRKMFLQMVEWHIGVRTNFTTAFNKGRNVQQLLAPDLYNRLLATYPDGNITTMWNALFCIADLFDELTNAIAEQLRLQYNKEEADNAKAYLRYIFTMPMES